MRIGETNSKVFRQADLPARSPNAAEQIAESRALVPVAPVTATHEPAPARDHCRATFLAHLIATKEQLPQTRERRRAEPKDAIGAYRAVAAIIR
jgi:hypothetical protein